MHCVRFICGILILAASSLSLLADADAVVGVWKTRPEKHGYAHIEIKRSGEEFVGAIVWMSEPNFPDNDKDGMAGKPKIDRKNPDPELRDRPLLGLEIINSFSYIGNDQWKHGRVYDPARGKTYRCQMKLNEDGTLKFRGFVGVSLLGRSTTWTRVPEAP